MKPSEIITADMERAGLDPAKTLAAISKAVKEGTGLILQENDSVLFLLNIGDNSAELHLYTVDTPIKVAKSLISFIKKIRNSETKKVYGDAEPTQTLQLLKNLDVDVQPSDNPKYKWMAVV